MPKPKTKKPAKGGKKEISVKDKKIKAVKLVCPNCGEEETRVIYCDKCDTPLEVVEVMDMDKNEAKGNAGVVHDNNKDKQEDEQVTESDLVGPDEGNVMSDGIGEIFPGDKSVDSIADDEVEGFENFEDVVNALGEE